MVKFVLQRLAGAVLVFFLVSLMVFAMVHLVPGDAAVVAAGEGASAEEVQSTRERLGLDRTMVAQYLDWAGGLLSGDLGESLVNGRSNADTIAQALPVTLSLAGLALLWSLAVGVAAGAVAGLRRGTWTDRVVTGVTTLGISIPSFWLGLLLVVLLALQFDLLPATGYEPLSSGVGPWLAHLVLPAVALGAVTAAEVARHTRAGVIDVMERDYIRTAYAKGLPRWKVVTKHIAKNAAIPVVTVFGLQAAALAGGAVVIEQVFGLSGLGSVALRAILERDVPVVQAFVVVVTIVVLLINLLVDVSYGYFDPKVRQS